MQQDNRAVPYQLPLPISQVALFNELTNNFFKMDILFYNSIEKAKNDYLYRVIYFVIALIIVSVFLGIDVGVSKTQKTVLVVFMAVAIGVIVLNILVTLGIFFIAYANDQQNNTFFLNISQASNHSVLNEKIEQGRQKLQDCVSKTIYNYNTGSLNTDEGLTKSIRKQYQSINSSNINQQVLNYNSCLSCLQNNARFLIFALVIFGVIALASSKPSASEIAILTVLIVYLSFYVIIGILVLIIIALSPLLLIIACIFCCVKGDPTQLQLPQPVEATLQMIQKTEGSCSICLQNFKLKEQVIALQCSDKHVFHQGCITNWTRVSGTCPMCRKPIGES